MEPFNKRAFVIVASLLACGAQILYPQAVTLSSQDMQSAEVRYHDLAIVGGRGHSVDLHSADTFPDGARGYSVGTLEEHDLTPIGPFKNEAEAQFHDLYCRAATIVIAREVSAQSILSTKNDMIFTLFQFLVTDTLKPSPDASIGAQIEVMRFGGEVTDNGELLRVQYAGQVPFTSGKTYLLVLNRDAQNSSSHFFGSNRETIPVKNGRIYPPSGSWATFVSGELLTSIHERTNEMSATAACGN